MTSDSFSEKLQRNPEEILEIFWDNFENLSRGASILNSTVEKRFIFRRLMAHQLIRWMINWYVFDQLSLILLIRIKPTS